MGRQRPENATKLNYRKLSTEEKATHRCFVDFYAIWTIIGESQRTTIPTIRVSPINNGQRFCLHEYYTYFG